MALGGMRAELTNWTKTAHSSCVVYRVNDYTGIADGLAFARQQHLTVIPRGAGHSYTDAALNTGGVVIDVTPMRRILSWDPAQGIMRVEPGVTLQEMVVAAWKDGWWPVVSPSTPEVTVGGCAAMNINGRNAWKCGPFGGHVLALGVLLPNGETLTLTPQRDAQIFHAFIGSMGLLGILTSITVQLQRISTGSVTARRRSAASLAQVFTLFAEEEASSDFLEAWIDGFATGDKLGRGHLTSAKLSTDPSGNYPPLPFPAPGMPGQLEKALVSSFATLSRPALIPLTQVTNRLNYGWYHRGEKPSEQQRLLFPYTFWPAAAFTWYHATFPQGVETFQAFVSAENAQDLFGQVLRYSQQQGCWPLWCVIKRHRSDPFLLSYQVDGFSLELNYQRTRNNAAVLKKTLEFMIAAVIEGGGRFYLAKDHFLTHDQYRQSVGDAAVDTFLRLKQRFDPHMLLQSDLYRRVFQGEGGDQR